MLFQSPGAIAFSIGSLSVHWYGILIVLGIISAYTYAMLESKRRHLDVKILDDMVVWVVIGGIIGARLWYVLFNLSYYIASPLEIFTIWNGGLAIHGGLIGGALVYFFYVWRKKIRPFTYVDAIIPGVLLAQAIGRWGNFFNSEAFGSPTTLPWGVFIPTSLRPAEFVESAFFHPTFLYESLWNLLGFGILVFLSRRPRFKEAPGSLLAFYLIYYSLGRFFIEALRTDSLFIGSLKTAQLTSVIACIAGILLMIFTLRKAGGKS